MTDWSRRIEDLERLLADERLGRAMQESAASIKRLLLEEEPQARQSGARPKLRLIKGGKP